VPLLGMGWSRRQFSPAQSTVWAGERTAACQGEQGGRAIVGAVPMRFLMRPAGVSLVSLLQRERPDVSPKAK
jgi:hypothetical protein